MHFFLNVASWFIFSSEKRKLFRKRHSGVVKRYHSFHKKFHVGTGSYLGVGCRIENKETVIGNYCSVAPNVFIGTSMHPTDYLSSHPFQYRDFFGLPGEIPEEKRCHFLMSKPCRIGNDVWIGMNAVIMDGVEIGDGAVVGAQAVVTKNVPPYAIVAGVPARILRYRFPEETAQALLRLKWWDLPQEQIQELPFDDVPACIRQLESLRAAQKTGKTDHSVS